MERKQIYSFTLSKETAEILKNAADLQEISMSQFLDNFIKQLKKEDKTNGKRKQKN